MTTELTKKAVEFTVTTDAPGFTLKIDGEQIPFGDSNTTTIELNEGWEYIVYYELEGAQLGNSFKMEVSEASRPVDFTVQTESGSVFGFTGFVVSPAA